MVLQKEIQERNTMLKIMNRHYDHCDVNGHTLETGFTLHAYPNYYKELKYKNLSLPQGRCSPCRHSRLALGANDGGIHYGPHSEEIWISQFKGGKSGAWCSAALNTWLILFEGQRISPLVNLQYLSAAVSGGTWL